MGLQGHLNDVASDSIPLYLVSLLAVFFNHLRSLFRFGSHQPDPTYSFLGAGLANLVVLSDQLSLNRLLSYSYSDPKPSDCVFCLNTLRSGDRVRKLDCCHVFHKDCLDGWLDQLKFSCPLCRSTVGGVSGESHDLVSNRIGGELIECFGF